MGAFSASVLSSLEQESEGNLVDYFDLITGTSTGGIIAICLGMGLSASEILKFYTERGPAIFKRAGITQRIGMSIRHVFQPKHSHEILKNQIQAVLGDKKFGESNCRLVIPTFDAVAGRIFLMKTAHHQRFRHDIDAQAVDVALATSAAPTYFSAALFPKHGNASYVDGGIWANCPALVGLVEAVHFLQQKPENIDILNIGTTSSPFSTSGAAQAGIFGWAKGLVNVFMSAQVQTSRTTAKLLSSGGLHTIDYRAEAGRFSLDNAAKIDDLITLGRGEAIKKDNLDC